MFCVISAKAVVIESLEKVDIKISRERLVFNQTNESEQVYCLVLYEVDSIVDSYSYSGSG